MQSCPNHMIAAKLTVLTVAFFAIGCDSPSVATRPEKLTSQIKVVKRISPIVDKTPDFIFTPEVFSREVKTNGVAATEKYKGKVIQLTGVLNKYLKNLSNDVSLCLQVSDYIVDVECFTTDPSPWTIASPGQTITVKGRFPEKFIIPQLEDCVILNVTGENRTTLTVQELAKAYAADPKGTMEMYYDKSLILTGIVESKVEDERQVGDVHVTFETGSKVKVVADFDKLEGEAGHLKIREAAQIIGRFTGDKSSEAGALRLRLCFYVGAGK